MVTVIVLSTELCVGVCRLDPLAPQHSDRERDEGASIGNQEGRQING